MMYDLIIKLLNINWPAQWSLNRCSEKSNIFVCRGKIQLTLCPDTIIKTGDKPCYIGIPLLGRSTKDNDTTIINCGSSAVFLLDGCTIGRGVILTVGSFANLTIGKNSYVTDGSRIAAQNSISIGDNCAISFGVTIIDDDGHGFGLPPYSAPIVIEDNVWVGCNVTILKGVSIGEGSVIAAGAVVTKSCPSHSLMAGVPARVIREGVNWTDKSRLG